MRELVNPPDKINLAVRNLIYDLSELVQKSVQEEVMEFVKGGFSAPIKPAIGKQVVSRQNNQKEFKPHPLGEKIRKFRAEHGFSQLYIAEAIKEHRGSLANLEMGRWQPSQERVDIIEEFMSKRFSSQGWK